MNTTKLQQGLDAAFLERVEKIRHLMATRNLSAVVLRKNPNLAWLIGGRVHVPSVLDMACFDIVVGENSIMAITNVIEAPRLAAEEFPNGIDVDVINWWQERDPRLPHGSSIGCDNPGADRIDLSSEIEVLRSSLIAADQARFAKVCEDAATALGNAMKEVRADDREVDVAARITNAMWRADLEAVFLGVAGDLRVRKFRHPLPTTQLIGSRVVASICARRKGLIASVTRIVTFDAIPQTQGDEYSRLLQVESAIMDAVTIGDPFAKVVQAATKAYQKFGFNQDEWRQHHQGGPTGYLPRDWPATLESTRLIAPDQAVAWNPTAQGWKVEDTWLTSDRGARLLSVDSGWPTLKVGGRSRPGLLLRP
ncbi:MAG: M24 family metallopeptidase [Actinobacteria bacterium]|nr:M24 family metallopeptidase [Actinomycetota bacterium]